MKKKLFLIVAIIIIAVFACMTLVACGGNDGNSGNNEFVEGDGNNGGNNQGEDNNGGNQDNENNVSPDATLKEFLDVWLKSSQKSFYQLTYDSIMVINGNIYCQVISEYTKYFEITGKNKANYFFGPKGSTNLDNWEIMKLKTIDEICNSVGIEEEYLQEVNSPKDIINFGYVMCFNDADLDVVFEKKGDIYIGKEDTDFENYTIKIADKVLT